MPVYFSDTCDGLQPGAAPQLAMSFQAGLFLSVLVFGRLCEWRDVSINHPSSIHQSSIKHLSNIYQTSIKHLSIIYQPSINYLQTLARKTRDYLISHSSTCPLINTTDGRMERKWKIGALLCLLIVAAVCCLLLAALSGSKTTSGLALAAKVALSFTISFGVGVAYCELKEGGKERRSRGRKRSRGEERSRGDSRD